MRDDSIPRSALDVDCSLRDAQQRFAGHFAHQVVIPGAALLDRIVLELEAMTGCKVTSVKHAKFVAAVLPSQPLALRTSVVDVTARFELLRGNEIVCSGAVTLEGSV